MIKPKEKKCKGTRKAKDYGCGSLQLKRTYGLGHNCGCYRDWLLNSEEGKKKLERSTIKATETRRSLEKAEKERKIPKRKLDLQKEINKLSRMIDKHFEFKCIDCDNPFGKQTDAAHLHNVQGNENIRYNLHNLHSARTHCNKFNSEHKVGYRKGIAKRYGNEYLEFIDVELPKKYKYLGLLDNEVKEKLSIVRKLIRDFETFNLKDGIQAREMFNKIIGIYK
jgi:hypothetical protein